jgi:hypothetical protein
MCGGVEYPTPFGELVTVYFPVPTATLPVITKSHELAYLPWGRRRGEEGLLPVGGWARHESIEKGIWQKWNPVPVKIKVERYMEKDSQKVTHWFDMPPRHVIQGLVASRGDEQRVYVVTVPAEGEFAAIHDRWPRIVEATPKP